jgi:hypothetical protein
LACIAWDSGIAPRMIRPNTSAITGITAISTHASSASCDRARITPPIAIIGAVMTMVSIMITICWTWVVSLVVRVASDAAPKPSNWWIEKRSARAKIAPRRILPNPVATFDA